MELGLQEAGRVLLELYVLGASRLPVVCGHDGCQRRRFRDVLVGWPLGRVSDLQANGPTLFVFMLPTCTLWSQASQRGCCCGWLWANLLTCCAAQSAAHCFGRGAQVELAALSWAKL